MAISLQYDPSRPAGFDLEEKRQNRYSLLRAISMIQTPLTGIALVIWIILFFATGQMFIIQFLLSSTLITFGSLTCSLLLIFRKLNGLDQATFVMFASLLLTTAWVAHLAGVSSGILGLYVWTLILASLLDLPLPVLQSLSGIVIIGIVLPIIAQSFGLVTPLFDVAREAPIIQLVIWVVIVALVIAGLVLYKQRLGKVLFDRLVYSRKMEELNRQLAGAASAGSDLSVRVNSMSMELQATSQQQAVGATQQSRAVLEITTSLEELGQSGQQIASNARQVFTESARALEIAREVKQVSEEAAQVVDRGQQAVEASISNFEQVQLRIEAVAQRLLALTESSKQIGAVIEIISNIADETHLLALNATIESAGAGENGLRFGVIASEVKSLADRVIASTKEVKKIIAELQGAVTSAVLAAEESKKETNQAVHQSYESGMVISEVRQVVDLTANRGNAIAEYVESFSQLAEDITLAMQQQQRVNGQLAGTVKSIKAVAQETAAGSHQVAETVHQLWEMIHQLKEVLAIEEKLVA